MKTKSKILSLFTLLLLAASPVYAGKGKGGGGGGGGGPKGGGGGGGSTDTIPPPVIQSVIKESSRRLHIISQKAGELHYITNIKVTNLANPTDVANFGCGIGQGCYLEDVRIEGLNLKGGQSYSIIAQSFSRSSAPVNVTMLPDVPEQNLPVAGIPYIVPAYNFRPDSLAFSCADDTQVQGYRVFFNGELREERTALSDIMSFWTASGTLLWGGNRCGINLFDRDLLRGQTIQVDVELYDLYGNVQRVSAGVQF